MTMKSNDKIDAWPWDPTRPVAGQYEEWVARIAEQTRHDVAASVARHAEVDDASIRRLRDGSAEGTASDALVRRSCSIALGEVVSGMDSAPTASEVVEARQRCADRIARHRDAADLPGRVPHAEDQLELPATECCPRCGSRKPHLHPAIQHGGEVQVCNDAFHLRITSENTPEKIRAAGLGQAAPPAAECRRCSECEGEDHHWIENTDFSDEGDPEFQCKHCPAYCDSEDDQDGLAMPTGVVRAWTPPFCSTCGRHDDEPCDVGSLCPRNLLSAIASAPPRQPKEQP